MGYNLALLLCLWVATMAVFEQLETPFKLVFNQCLVDLGFFCHYIIYTTIKKAEIKKKE